MAITQIEKIKKYIERKKKLDHKIMELRGPNNSPSTFEGYVEQAKKYLTEEEFEEFKEVYRGYF